MKVLLKTVLLAIPFSAIVACGSPKSSWVELSGEDSASSNEIGLAGELALLDDSEGVLEDHLEELPSVLEMEDELPESTEAVSNPNANKERSKVKACSIDSGILTLSREKSKQKDVSKAFLRGPVERSYSSESSYKRIYSTAEGKELAVECKSDQGPVGINKEKISHLEGSRYQSTYTRTSLRSRKINGSLKSSRQVESTGTRSAVFGAALESEGHITINKSVSISSSSNVTKFEKAKTQIRMNLRKTIEDSPLQIEELREIGSGALVHKLIHSGRVLIEQGENRKMEITYEEVKYSSECNPVSGRMIVTKSNTLREGGQSSVLNVRFENGEVYLSRNGKEEKKMEELNLKLRDCRASAKK